MTDKIKNIIFTGVLVAVAILYWAMVFVCIKKSFEPTEKIPALIEQAKPQHTLYVDQAKVYGLSGSKNRFRVFVTFP